MSKTDKSFLVRSSGQILGPYSKKEVEDLIRRGKVSIFDEVAEPFAIWRCLQDHQEFKKVVQSIGVQTRLTNFLTQISGKISTISKNTKTEDQTVTETADKTRDTKTLSKVAKGVQLDAGEKLSALEVKVKTVDQPAVGKPSTAHVKYHSKIDSEEITKRKISLIVRTVWQTIVIFALLIGGYVLYREIIAPAQQEKTARGEFTAKAMKFYTAGDYKEALPLFEEAYSKDILQEEEKLLLAGLYIHSNKLQRASLTANELSPEALQNSGDWFLLKGLLSFYQKDFRTAEQNFQSAQKQKPQAALLNLSLLKWKTGDYKSSEKYLEQLMKIGYERDVVFYLKALNLLSQNQIGALSSYLNEEVSLNKPASLTEEYKQEFYFMQAYSYLKEQKLEEMKEAIRNLLNEDPFFSQEYQYSPFIALNTLNWQIFQPYCKSIFDADPQNNLLNALYGFCFLKIGRFQQGAKYIEQAKNGAPSDLLFHALSAYLFMLERKDVQLEQALSMIDFEKLKEGQNLPFILKARFLEGQKDWGRALAVWKSLLAISAGHLSGVAGVAVASFQLGDYSTGRVYRDRGLNKYRYHVSLLPYLD